MQKKTVICLKLFWFKIIYQFSVGFDLNFVVQSLNEFQVNYSSTIKNCSNAHENSTLLRQHRVINVRHDAHHLSRVKFGLA